MPYFYDNPVKKYEEYKKTNCKWCKAEIESLHNRHYCNQDCKDKYKLKKKQEGQSDLQLN